MVLITVAALAAGATWLVPQILKAVPMGAAVTGAILYLAAHVVRAVRLAVLAGPLLGVSGRAAAALHLVTAPVAFVLPFKLGELFRLQQLFVIGRRLSNAIVVILLDRMFDALFLLPIFLTVGATHGWNAIDPPLLQLTAVAALLPLMTVALGPGIFGALQDYVVIHHWNRHLFRLLPTLNQLRIATKMGLRAVKSQWAQLSLISMVIWTTELAAARVFVNLAGPASSRDTAFFLTEKLAYSWWPFSDPWAPTTVGAAAAVGLVALLGVWPAALLLYLRGIDLEPRRLRRSAKRETES